VDDEPELTRALATFLSLRGIESDTESDPNQAIERIAEGNYQVVLLDIIMPHKDGLEVLREVKNLKPNTEVVMMTANSTMERVKQARELGASDFILKPFADLEQMGNIVLLTVERVERWDAVMVQSPEL